MYKRICPGAGPIMIPGASCVAKFVEVHKVMLHAKYKSSKLFGLNIKLLSLYHIMQVDARV